MKDGEDEEMFISLLVLDVGVGGGKQLELAAETNVKFLTYHLTLIIQRALLTYFLYIFKIHYPI